MTDKPLPSLLERIRTARSVQAVRAAERELLRRIRSGSGTPVIELETAHFFFRSEDDVSVSVSGDWNRWQADKQRLVRLHPRSVLLHTEQDFPIDAALPYRLIVDGESVLDPMNQRILPGPLGTNSFFSMPAYPGVPYWHLSENDVPRGRLIELYAEGNASVSGRVVGIYIPHDHEPNGTERFLYVNDGAEAISIGRFNTVLDNIYRFEPFTPNTIVVFVPPVDRHGEYMMNPDFARWFANDLTKQVEKRLNVTSRASLRTIQGASLGGLFAAFVGLQHSNRFRNIVSQSPSFWVDDFSIVRQFERTKRLPLRWYLHTGTISDGRTEARKMLQVLRAKGNDVCYRETSESHNWANWAGQYAAIVRWIGK
ncbi:MAG: hypothetical protein JSS75_02475 [Bacteroidetes bacterium]|nr:hypothetical protein [Bacteroidota bacterium]